jgi:hypothetical protein
LAVADANLVIQRLCSTSGADLVGEINLALEGATPGPIAAVVDLNFCNTVGSDELSIAAGGDQPGLMMSNLSPLDLAISRYAAVEAGVVAVCAQELFIAADATAAAPLPASTQPAADLQIAADGQLVIPAPMTASQALRFLNFVSVNVADAHIFIAVDGSTIDYARTSAVTATVVFDAGQGLSPTPFALTAAAPVASAQVVLPLQDAVFSVPASVSVAASFSGGGNISFSAKADFASQPTFAVTQAMIDANTPAPAA